jgi:cell division septum initiation protein DivIVA
VSFEQQQPTGGGGGGNHEQPDAETLMRRVVDIINNAKPIPLSATVRLENRDEVVELMNEALERLPGELRQARWMLKERAEFLAKVQREADEILESARVRAERMVQRTEIVREAQHLATKTVEEARDESRRLRLEAEDYCDQKLASFEIVLERTIKTVQAGREKLHVNPLPAAQHGDLLGAPDDADAEAADEAFFDQDS